MDEKTGSRSVGRKGPFLDKPLAKVDSIVEIDLQNDDGGPPDGRPPYQPRSLPGKMPRPLVPPRMKEGNELFRPGIDPGDIRPFVTVAEDANRLHPKFSLVDPPSRSP